MARKGTPTTPKTYEPYEGLLSGYTWSSSIVTYSFPDSPSDYGRGYSEANSKKFASLSIDEQSSFQTVINQVVGFTEIELRLGADDGSADIRIGKSTLQGADAWAYYPGPGKGGDVWLDRGLGDSYGGMGGMNWEAIQPGDYSYTVFMHEFGHALGLKHSFENGGVGPVPKQYDSLEYTVMSYDAYQTNPYSSSVDQRDWWADDGNNPQTFMMLDILALQKMYGADYTSAAANPGDTVYRWDSSGGMSINGGTFVDLNDRPEVDTIFMTVWDGGGVDTYDFSGLTVPVSIDLNPGGWVTIDYKNSSNPVQRADLLAGDGEHWATGNIANALLLEKDDIQPLIENAIGGNGDDRLIGNQTSNVLEGGAGNDVFVFNTSLGSWNVDVIVDYVVADDTIWLEDSIFMAFSSATEVSAGAFNFGAAALEEDDRLLYDVNTGYLFYDSDGLGGEAAVQFASLSGGLALSSSEFLII